MPQHEKLPGHLMEQANAHEHFVDYFAQESQSTETRERFLRTRQKILGLRASLILPTERLTVADIGCGAGTQSMLWAEAGHDVSGIDISAPLIDLARKRTEAAGLKVCYEACGAEQLPFADQSCDVVLMPELLEHVRDWQTCLNEAIRILKPQGILFLTTTNCWCPKQQEFDLPFYSWYPAWLKRYCEKLATTTRREWVSYASFPAVHWFSYFQLSRFMRRHALTAFNRFDLLGMQTGFRGSVARMVSRIPPLHWLGQICTPYTVLLALRKNSDGAKI